MNQRQSVRQDIALPQSSYTLMNRYRIGFLIAMFTVLVLTGCDEVVTRYDTLNDAKFRRAFERGWLPPLLPDSSRTIVERNDLDANIGTG